MKQLSTQEFLEFKQIRDGVVVLKNNALRIVLMVSSLNFALKSEDEQNGIIYQFQSFLNSLDFPVQILIQSRKLNMIGYLDKLKEIEKKEKHELIKTQITEYHKFIENIVTRGSIMQKTFYVVVPFSILETQGLTTSQIRKQLTRINKELTEDEFQRAKIQLLQRTEFVALGLRNSGLQAVPLNTLENVELFWGLHHPKEAERGYYPEFPLDLIE